MPPSTTSFPWPGISPGQAGPYTDTQFAAFIAQLYDRPGVSADVAVSMYSNSGAGLFPSNLLLGFGMDVFPNASPNMSVNVGNGAAIVNGKYVTQTGTALNLVVSGNSSGNPRIDTVVIHLDYTLATATIILLTGTPAGTPVPPSLTRTPGVIWEVPLCDVAVANGASSITLANLTPRQIPQAAPDGVYMPVLNNSGVTLQTGDIVEWDTSTTQAVKTSTTQNDSTIAGVMVGRTTAAAIGLLLVRGIGWMNVGGAVSIGQYIAQSTTAKQGVAGASGVYQNAIGYAMASQAGTGLIPCFIDASILRVNALFAALISRLSASFKAVPGFSFTSLTFVTVNTSTCRLSITTTRTNTVFLVTVAATINIGVAGVGYMDMLIDGSTYASGGNASGSGLSQQGQNESNQVATFIVTLSTIATHTLDLVVRNNTGTGPCSVVICSATMLEIG